MPSRIVTVGELDDRKNRLAYERLKNSLPTTSTASDAALSTTDFVTFKRMLELYIKQLDFQVLAPGSTEIDDDSVSLVEYCRSQKKRILDLLVDELDPETAISPTPTVLELSDIAADVIADDILSLKPRDLDYLSMIDGPHRANKIIRRLGSLLLVP